MVEALLGLKESRDPLGSRLGRENACLSIIYRNSNDPVETQWASQMALVVKNLPASVGDPRDSGSITETGRSPGVGSDNPLRYSYLENPMGREAWWATVHGPHRVGHDRACVHIVETQWRRDRPMTSEAATTNLHYNQESRRKP